MPNLLSPIAKFIVSTVTSDDYCAEHFPDIKVYEEFIPVGQSVESGAIMFVMDDTEHNIGAFGQRIMSTGMYQIKGVVEGSDYSPLDDLAHQIDRLFDWSNQIDPDAGRPRCQEVFTDPDSGMQLMIMGMINRKDLKFSTFLDGVNYCHLGARYEIQYYKL